MGSINQNTQPASLPDFCNLGVILRVLIVVNGLAAAAALVRTQEFAYFWRELLLVSSAVQPAILASLLLLCAVRRWLGRLRYEIAVLAVAALELLVASVLHHIGALIEIEPHGYSVWHYWLFALFTTAVVLAYLNLRSRALSPAIAESRLQALQARIRPHFLFNSLNAVLGLIRSEPKRAERALEDMADLFRVLMADNRELTNLGAEVTLSRQYLEIEQLRLGERLRIAWHTDKMPHDALIPPLVLQPLLENAVYHGIEPASTPGEININVYRNRDQVFIVLRNPYHMEGSHHSGNKMALNNIRERLALHFDAEASLKTQITGNAYQVTITLPYLREAPAWEGAA